MTVPASLPPDEAERLAALLRYAILDTDPDACLDRIVTLAARQFQVPIALVSLIDQDRQWFKAACGLSARQTDRDVAFCAHAILGDGVFVVPDATQDPRFAANPLVAEGLKIRFYAGAPLINPDGYKLGTLCLIDTLPRHGFSSHDHALLADLAAVVVDQIEMRYATGDFLDEVETRIQAEQDLATAEHQLDLFFQYAPVSVAMFDRQMRYLAASDHWRRTLQIADRPIVGEIHFDVVPHIPAHWKAQYEQCLTGEMMEIAEDKLPRSDGGFHWVWRQIRPWRDRTGAIGGLIISIEIIDERKRASMALERSRAFTEAVLHNIQDGIVACDADGRVTHFNDASLRFLGAACERTGPQQWSDECDFFEADGRTPLAADAMPLVRALAGETVDKGDIVVAPRGGERRTLVTQATPMFDVEGQRLGAVASMHDVSNERDAVERWRQAHLLYRAIFDQTFQLCGLLDAQGTVLEANQTALDFAGVGREDVVGRPFWDCHWWQVGEAAQCKLKEAVVRALTGQFVRYEVEVQGRRSSRRPIDFSLKPITDEHGKVTMLIAEGRDIGDRRRSEEALRANEERYRQLYNKTPVMLHSIDPEGRLLSVSDAWLDKLGYSREEVIGRKSVEFLTPESARKAAEEILPEFIRTGQCKDIEYQAITKSGDVLDILLSAVAEKDGRDKVIRSMAVLTDVTERKSMERQLIQAQKMESVGQLTGGLAHDFNNLLGVVLGNLQLVERSIRSDEKQAKRIQAAIGAVERGAELTRRLLAFSRRQILETEVLEPNPLIESLSDMLKRTLGESIRLDCSLGHGIPRVRTDASQLESAILNLAVNARDAMPNGGTLTIESQVVQLDEGYAARESDVKPGCYVVLAVTDTGTGIDPDRIDRVFEPFFTTKEVGSGSGLGLSMVYGFLKQSGGHARIYSEVGRGTTVRLYLPVATSQPDRSGPKLPGRDTEDAGGDETILVVEDQDDVRDVAVALLEDLGYQVCQAADARSGLDVLNTGDGIDLLFTDLVMPGGMDGTMLAREARAIRPDLAIVFTTGFAEAAVLHGGDINMMDNLVTKPYRRTDLALKIRRALDEQRSRTVAFGAAGQYASG